MSTSDTKCVETLADPEDGAVWRELPRSFGIRRRLKLTAEQFAERFGIPVETVRDWETGVARPDAVADAYLRVIAREPDAVARAVAAGARSAAE
jgi:Helix-turn-helix